MNREIKFRAYVFADKKMYNVLSVSGRFADEEFNRIFIAKESMPGQPTNLRADSKNAALMQFTGSTDKNRKDIFESDIIIKADHPKDKNKYVVCWLHDGWKMLLPHEFQSEFHTGAEERLSYHTASLGKFEVIGNIYEHPHLLKK